MFTKKNRTNFEVDHEKLEKASLKDTFEDFTSIIQFKKEQTGLTFKDFSKIFWERGGYPEIIHDLLFYLAEYRIVKVQEENKPDYPSELSP